MPERERDKLRRQGVPDHRRYWLSLLNRDVDAARAIVEQALETLRPGQVYLRLIMPALNLSGGQFFLKKITYEQEHFITWHTVCFMRTIVRRQIAPVPVDGPIAIATGVGQDSHRVGLQMVCDILRTDGWQIRMLETNERGVLTECLRQNPAASALLISIGYTQAIPLARRLITHARRMGFGGTVCIGGRAVVGAPDVLALTGSDMTGVNGLDILQRLRTVRRPAIAARQKN